MTKPAKEVKVDDKVIITGFGRYCKDFLTMTGTVEAKQPHPYIPWREAFKIRFREDRHGWFFEGEFAHVQTVS